jgi:hypothetical protein
MGKYMKGEGHMRLTTHTLKAIIKQTIAEDLDLTKTVLPAAMNTVRMQIQKAAQQAKIKVDPNSLKDEKLTNVCGTSEDGKKWCWNSASKKWEESKDENSAMAAEGLTLKGLRKAIREAISNVR